MNEELEHELREFIAATLALDKAHTEHFDVDTPLLVEGLALDSLDAMELALAIERRYHIEIKAEDVRNRAMFGSVRSLAAHIAAHRAEIKGVST